LINKYIINPHMAIIILLFTWRQLQANEFEP
jgi:hypothetical protein